jgi:hypothetical protein
VISGTLGVPDQFGALSLTREIAFETIVGDVDTP